MTDYPRLWVDFVHLFNIERDYFECHEYGEHLWLEWGRPVELKGMIQAAVCLYHLQGGNVKGGRPMWNRSRLYLNSARPVYLGVDVDQLIRDIDAVYAKVPDVWRLTQTEIAELQLPTVSVRVVDPELTRILEGWVVTPIEEEEA